MKILVAIREILFFLTLFMNPFGFDIIVATLMSLTSSYWVSVSILYCCSLLCFILYRILIASYTLLPLGYDILFSYTMKITGSFLNATITFYFISFTFFCLYLITRYITKKAVLNSFCISINKF